MGKGTSKVGGSATKSKGVKVGGSVNQLEKYTKSTDALKRDFGLDKANDTQLNAVQRIMRGVLQHDKGSDGKTPYNIVSLQITQIDGITPTVSLTMRTTSNSDNPVVRMMDEKTRRVLIGRNGGLFTYDDKGNRVKVKDFDAMYGKRSEY